MKNQAKNIQQRTQFTEEERAALRIGFSICLEPLNNELYVVQFPEGDFTSATDLETAREWMVEAYRIELRQRLP